ncbi:MAG: SpoIIE family protein phosphatase [Candidatus Promineifilaceae bacterium]
MLDTILLRNHAQFNDLACSWLDLGAEAFSIWFANSMLACWPEKARSVEPTMLAPILHNSVEIGELRVTGIDSPTAQKQLQAQAQLVANMVRLETELNSMTAELIDTRDHLVALYELMRVTSNVIDIRDTLRWLASESKRLIDAEGAFVILQAPESGLNVQQHYPEQLLSDEDIQKYLSEMFRTDDPFLCRRGVGPSVEGSFRSLMLIPMQVRGTTLAVLGLINKVGGDFMSPDIKLTQTIAAYGAAQIENVLLYQARIDQTKLQAEMDLARRIQVQLLPDRMPKVAGLDSWASSRPASRVGGDFYTAIEQPNEAFTFAVGDISGKGLPAAILMAMTRTILRSNTTVADPVKPAGIIDISNRELYHDFYEVSMFATVFVGQYHPITRSLSYANAGHSPVVYVPAGKEAQLLPADSTPMGIEPQNEAVNKELIIRGGDVLVIASDGLNEARNGQNEMFGYNRLLRLIEDLAHKPAHQISEELFQAVDEFSAGLSQDDDQTVVVLKGEHI